MELQGQGFKLRGWHEDDAESIQKHADNPNIYSYLTDRFPRPYNMEAARNWVNMMLHTGPHYNFVIDVDGFAMGVIGLDMRDDIYRKAPLLGYWLSQTLWGHGIMPQAIKLLTTHAFDNLDIVRIQAGVLSNNPRSMRVLEKSGFVKEGILRNNVIKNDVILDEHIYGLLK